MDSIRSGLQFSQSGCYICFSRWQSFTLAKWQKTYTILSLLLISSEISIVIQMRTPFINPCLKEYRRYKFMFEQIFPSPICQQDWRLDEIYTYEVEKNKRANSISMRMFKQAKFICSYAEYGKSYILEKIHHWEMFECLYRSILCPAQGCKFINNVETVIFQFINCQFHLLYFALCKSLRNVSVLTNDCNVIKFQLSIPCLLNIITRIRQPITSIKMCFSVIIHTLRLLR